MSIILNVFKNNFTSLSFSYKPKDVKIKTKHYDLTTIYLTHEKYFKVRLITQLFLYFINLLFYVMTTLYKVLK